MSKRINTLFFNLGNSYFIDVVENKEANRIDFYLSNEKYAALKVQFDGPAGLLRQNFKTIEKDIKDQAKNIIREYHKIPFVRNQCDLPLPVIIDDSKIKLSKTFLNTYTLECKDGYEVEVIESQNNTDLTINRKFYIVSQDKTYKYCVSDISGEQENLEPMESVIDTNLKDWISLLNNDVIYLQNTELCNIKEVLDESIFNKFTIRAFTYEDGSFCVHTNDGDIDMFYKFDDYKKTFAYYSSIVEEKLNAIIMKSTELHIRKRLNNCRKYLADKNLMLFISEMSIIKGLLFSYNKIDINLEELIPEEKHIMTFVKKYEEISSQKFLDLTF